MAAPRKIIIDTDPGQDDAVAILLALASPDEIAVLGITAVAGNVPLALTATNARIVCELAGRRDVRVFAGADRPLVRALRTAEHVHGATGLNGPALPAPTMPLQDRHGVDFIVDTGATDIVLTRSDAAKAGLDPENLHFLGRASTANGEVRTATVRLDSVSIGPHTDTNVPAVVNDGALWQSLLGMGYLQTWGSIEISGGEMRLSR